MIYPETDLKLRLTATIDGFSLTDDKFEIIIKNRWGRLSATITKDECFQDSEDRWYFTVENVKAGVYYATFIGFMSDKDYSKGERVFTDCQPIYEVGSVCCGSFYQSSCQCEHQVQYKQVYTVNLDDGTYLADVNGEPILAADGHRIRFRDAATNESTHGTDPQNRLNMTFDEFKTKIEGTTDNGVTDTVPEMEQSIATLEAAKEQNKVTAEQFNEIFPNNNENER